MHDEPITATTVAFLLILVAALAVGFLIGRYAKRRDFEAMERDFDESLQLLYEVKCFTDVAEVLPYDTTIRIRSYLNQGLIPNA